MFRTTLLFACFLLISRGAAGQPGGLPDFPVDEDHLAKLDAPIGEMTFDNVTLEKAIDLLSEKTRANVVIDIRALEGAGFNLKQKVHLKLYDMTLSRAIRVTLAAFTDAPVSLGFSAADGVIRVSTVEELSAKTIPVTRIYDIHDFLEPLISPPPRQEVTPPPQPVKAPATQSWPGGLFEGGGRNDITRQERIDNLTRLLEESIDINTWRDNGGQIGAIREWDGLMLVTQTLETQRKIQRTLQDLRSLRESIRRGEQPATRPVDLLRKP